MHVPCRVWLQTCTQPIFVCVHPVSVLLKIWWRCIHNFPDSGVHIIQVRVGLSPKGLPASRFRDKWQIWGGKRKTCFSPSRIVTFLPIQKRFVPAGPKCDVFREGCDKKRHNLKNIFPCARALHSSQKFDKSNASYFLSPKKVSNVTSLTQIWDGNLGRNSAKTDPKPPKPSCPCPCFP